MPLVRVTMARVQRREAAHRALRDHKTSQRRVCDLVGAGPKTVRRERPPDHADIRKKMHEIAGTRRRFGYPLADRRLPAIAVRRRIGVMLERDGFTMNGKKLYPFTRAEEDQFPDKGPVRVASRSKARTRNTDTDASASPAKHPLVVGSSPLGSNQWRNNGSISDTFGASRKFRVLAVIDDCTRENLALIADTSLSGARVARDLTALIRIYRKPDCIFSDRRRSENDPGDRFPEEGRHVHQHVVQVHLFHLGHAAGLDENFDVSDQAHG